MGAITVENLVKKGCKVYLAARSEEKAKDAISEINRKNPGKEANLVFLPFDMTDLKSIKKAAETVKEKEDRLDIVVNNAGEHPFLVIPIHDRARLNFHAL